METTRERRVAVVTGGTGALGRWVVQALVQDGFAVFVPWIDAAQAEDLTAFLGGEADAVHLSEADVTSPAAVEAFFTRVEVASGRLDALCNLAGGFTAAALETTDPEAWTRMQDLNATSAFLCARAAAPLLRRSGGGRIVNVAALPALERGAPGMSAYAAAKASLVSLTLSLARELRRSGVTVNALAPEILDTPDNRAAMPDADPAGWVHPREAARTVSFLLGEGGAVVTGSVLVLARVAPGAPKP